MSDSGENKVEELRRRVSEIEDKMDTCKDDLHERLTKIETLHISKLMVLETQMSASIKTMMDFVTKSQFEPVRLITYGLAGGILLTVMAALLAKVVI